MVAGRRYKTGIVLGVIGFLLSSCTINLGASSEKEPNVGQPPNSDTSIAVDLSANAEVTWATIVADENAFAFGEVSRGENGIYGVMAAPTLRIFEFIDGFWSEKTSSLLTAISTPPIEFDYDITIQSEDLTGDGALDFVVNFRPAPWDLFDVPNQGRDHGTVISNHGGTWRSLPMVEQDVNFTSLQTHDTVESIEFVDGVLFGAWYGSCGRPCGTLIYRWNQASQWLEGKEATKKQARQFMRAKCVDFEFNWTLPLKLCDAGTPVRYVQEALNSIGYELNADEYFGPGTRYAVQYYQRANGIRASGDVDYDTWRSLFAGVGLPGWDLNNDGVIVPEELSGT